MDDRIKKVLNYIEDNLGLSPNLAELSAVACLSPSQFHRVFKKETNSTPFQFIEKIKMNKAYQLLINKSFMVYELAENLGYNDYETFSRAFKKHFHFSPDDFKSITGKIKETLGPPKIKEFIIQTFDDIENEEELLKRLKQTMKEKNISEDDLQNAQIFKIAPKSDSTALPKNLIKDKYEITNEKRIWESLIDKTGE